VYQLVAGSGRPRVGALPGRPGEVQRQVADPRQAEERLGWQARTALDDGLHATIEWLRAQRHRSGD
jgi:nucleoside-diphosphate-sugar epimerase